MKTALIKLLPWLLLLVAIVGFFDATYLTTKHYIGGTVPCFITTGCDTVTTSEYAVVAGVPVALLGSIYYFFLFVLSLLLIESKKEMMLNVIIALTIIGFISSLYFVYLQIYVIQAICSYCMLSASTSTLALILSVLLKKSKLISYA